MDLLSQYKQDHPEAFRKAEAFQPSGEYGSLVRFVMRASGGRIREARGASIVLLIAAAAMAALAISIFFLI